jgi:hypothetical protein
MSATQGVGDRHPGQWIPFWQQACAENRAGACDYLDQLLATACGAGSNWACSDRPTGSPPLEELPILLRGSKGPLGARSPSFLYARACEQGWRDTCGRVSE